VAASLELRVGAVAGWISFLGVMVAFIAIPTVIAGQPPTAHTDLAAVMAYFRHPEFALINGVLGVIVGIVAIVPFTYGLRAAITSAGEPRARLFADFGLLFVVVAAPVYLVSSALGAMLVQAASGDPATFSLLFRFYDVMYDGGADILEGAWIGAFSLALLWTTLPRWIGWLGLVVLASRWIKAFVPVAPVPEVVIPVSGLLFGAWFLAVVVLVTREARRRSPSVATVPQPA
jgi:hypothetical protein